MFNDTVKNWKDENKDCGFSKKLNCNLCKSWASESLNKEIPQSNYGLKRAAACGAKTDNAQ